jgi:hypothetical protein
MDVGSMRKEQGNDFRIAESGGSHKGGDLSFIYDVDTSASFQQEFNNLSEAESYRNLDRSLSLMVFDVYVCMFFHQ